MIEKPHMIKLDSPLRDGAVAAIDIGDSQVMCLIATAGSDGAPRIQGVGVKETRGLTDAAVTDALALEKSIKGAVSNAEKMAQTTIENAIVSFNGGSQDCHVLSIEIVTDGHPIAEEDILSANLKARDMLQPELDAGDRRLVTIEAVGYYLDDVLTTTPPLGVFGSDVQVIFHATSASNTVLKNLEMVVARSHLNLIALVPAAIASALGVMTDDEKRRGCAVVDFGAGTREIAMFAQNMPCHMDIIKGGGNQITEDIAAKMVTPYINAERLKVGQGSATVCASDEAQQIEVAQLGDTAATPVRMRKSALTKTIEARLRDHMIEIRDCLLSQGFDEIQGANIILTGGVADTTGMMTLATELLGDNVRVARPMMLAGLPMSARHAMYASVIGLVIYTAGLAVPKAAGKRQSGGLRRLMALIFKKDDKAP